MRGFSFGLHLDPLYLPAGAYLFLKAAAFWPPAGLTSPDPAADLEEGVGQVESEGRAISLLPGFQIIEESANVGEEEVADLGFFVEWRFDLGKRVFQVPMPVGERKRGPDLLEAGSVLPVSQEPIGLQGSRERKTPRIETHGRCPGEERPPGALISRGAVGRKLAPSRPFERSARSPPKSIEWLCETGATLDGIIAKRPDLGIPLRRARRDAKTKTENLSWPTRQRQLALCVASSTHYRSAALAPFPEKVLTIWMAWEWE
jgi:hypothetical protein